VTLLILAAAACYVLYGAARFVWCGAWGCYQSGRGDVVPVLVLALAAGAVVGATAGILVWPRRRGTRLVVGLVVGVVVAMFSALYVLGL
jgi:hypothetical protein